MIYFDCEKMRYPNTGLYYYSYYLGKALLSTKYADRMGFFTPKSVGNIFGDDRHYLHRGIRTKYLLLDRDIELWHSSYQLSRYLPMRGKIIQTVHDLNFLYEGVTPQKQQRYMKRIHRHLHKINRIVAISEFVRQDILNHIDVGNIPVDVVYNGCNRFAGQIQQPKEMPKRPFLFSVATVLPKKNFHVLPCLLATCDYDLLIAGNTSDYCTTIIDEARKWGVADRVKFVGPVTEGEKHWYLSHCEAFLFPSIAEGFGLPPIEAMQYGKPVFLSDHTCLPEIGGESAFYFNHDFDREQMQREFDNGMNAYLANQQSFEARLKANAARFDWNTTARQYAELYDKVLGEN